MNSHPELRLIRLVFPPQQKELLDKDPSLVRLGDAKLLERVHQLETEAADTDAYADELEEELEELGAEKQQLSARVKELEVQPSCRCADRITLQASPCRRMRWQGAASLL